MNVDEFVSTVGKEYIDKFLLKWLTDKSISADKMRKVDCINAAQRLENELKSLGFNVRLIDLPDSNPLVYGELIMDKNQATVGVYGHYDVQPIHNSQLWVINGKTFDPFSPQIIDGKIYARGVADNKGQIMTNLIAMKYFVENGFPVNVKFLIEGQEENHNPALENFVRDEKNLSLLSCDVMFLTDADIKTEGVPCITTNMKGIIATQVSLSNPKSIVEIIHRMHNSENNTVLIPGFYDGIVPGVISEDLEAEVDVAEKSLGRLYPEKGYSQLYHRWYRPTFDPLGVKYVNGTPKGEGTSFKISVKGPNEPKHSGKYGGPVTNPSIVISHILHELGDYELDFIDYGVTDKLATSIHPYANAQITISDPEKLEKIIADFSGEIEFEKVDRNQYLETMQPLGPQMILSYRLVQGQDRLKIVKEMQKIIFENDSQAVFEKTQSADPFYIDMKSPFFAAVVSGQKQGYGTNKIHKAAGGGSIPIAAAFKDTLQVPIIVTGFITGASNLHSHLENMSYEQILTGARSQTYSMMNMMM